MENHIQRSEFFLLFMILYFGISVSRLGARTSQNWESVSIVMFFSVTDSTFNSNLPCFDYLPLYHCTYHCRSKGRIFDNLLQFFVAVQNLRYNYLII